ncbi:SMI1/KNR4 family protein [Streptomyces sp. CC224B]|uniref:SMI1/KNR4 family protein n=1 Tax=Streptomyces sp. CC224B TaxID=3044571 RepID=UPI0024A95DC8|nr:SMI1/KNR4 family protein [Streptomyces sp. CC224B]
MSNSDISHSWWRIKNWLRDRGRDRELAPGATPDEISLTEERLGFPIPPMLTASLRCHNGSGSFACPPRFEMLSCSGIVSAWESKTEVWPKDSSSPFSPHFVPFASDGSGGILYLIAGEASDTRIHEHSREGEEISPTSHPMWDSLSAYLYHTAEALETGEALDGYQRPDEDSTFLLWEDADYDEDDEE